MMSLGHLVRLESKGMFKNHIEGVSQDTGTGLEGLPVAKSGSVWAPKQSSRVMNYKPIKTDIYEPTLITDKQIHRKNGGPLLQ